MGRGGVSGEETGQTRISEDSFILQIAIEQTINSLPLELTFQQQRGKIILFQIIVGTIKKK